MSDIEHWISKAAAFPDPIMEVASNAKTPQVRINFLLLGCALQQNINLWELQFFLTELLKITDDVAEVPALPENLIIDIIKKTHLQNWPLAPQVCGIIWSVGRFARMRGNRLDLWLAERLPIEIWKECGEIFYMGKNSGIRPKALWLLHRAAFSNLTVKYADAKIPLPISAGARRWLIQNKIYGQDESPKEKLKTANSLYKELSPKNPALAAHALQFFAEPSVTTPSASSALKADGEMSVTTSTSANQENSPIFYFCQKIFPCELCPLSSYCRWRV